jgi:predicted nucleic acid-binding Zn ribbon protein
MPYVDDDNEDDSGEELDERELPDPSDYDDRDTYPCPHCGKEIYDDAEQCPECGKYIIADRGGRRKAIIICAAIVCLLIVLAWVFHDRQ